MGTFYEKQLRVPLSWWERRSLFSLWHVFNVVSDILIISGTVVKIALDYDVSCLTVIIICTYTSKRCNREGEDNTNIM